MEKKLETGHIRFQEDVDRILYNKESHLTSVQQEWNTMPADEQMARYRHYDSSSAFARFRAKAYGVAHNGSRRWQRIAGIAACVAVVVGIAAGMYLWPAAETSLIDTVAEIPAVNDSVPRLLLADGSVVNVKNGMNVAGLSTKINGNTIIIEETPTADDMPVEQQEIIIPRGRMYKLLLADGSKVMLNSESSIRFPNRFASARNVELHGQAFFEVAKNGNPFTVTTPHGMITVLGTTFSVSAYRNERFKVALRSGRIRFHNSVSDETIVAGQTITCDSRGRATVTTANLHSNTAWLEGLITFENADLEDIMHDIERMYDVRVHYSSDDMRHISFTGECSRFKTVDEFMNLLSLTEDFDFEIIDRDIYIRNKE